MRILVAEDDVMIGKQLLQSLRKSGHAVDWFRDGNEADAALQVQPFDLLLLDLGLPNRSGIEVLQRLRKRKDALPVIIITARHAIEDRIEGLDAGADDYLTKPFALGELEARMRAVERRRQGTANALLQYGLLSCDPAIREVKLGATVIPLSAKEYHLLYLLLRRRGAIVSRREMEEHLYNWQTDVDSNAIEVYVHRLRQKLGPKLIRTVRGLGYQLVES